MQLTQYRDEMSGAVNSLRQSLAVLWDEEDRRRAVREACRAVRRVQRRAKRLIHDRVTKRVPFPQLEGSRIDYARRHLGQIDQWLRNALAAINSAEPASSEETPVRIV
jgi:hypothetical protein